MSEIKQYTCIDCKFFSWCIVTGDGYCCALSRYVDQDSNICDEFIIDDYIRAIGG